MSKTTSPNSRGVIHSKEAVTAAEKLSSLFYLFGAPRILQSDNGKEFVARVIKVKIKKNCTGRTSRILWSVSLFFGGIKKSMAWPCHYKRTTKTSIGGHTSVECGNQTLELALGKWMQQNNTKAWSKGLSPAIYALNTSYAESTKETPYEVVFGQQPRCDLERWRILANSGIEDEEDLSADFAEQLHEPQPMIDVEPVDTEYITHNPTVTDTAATIPLDETQTVPMNLSETSNEVIDVPPACLNPTNRHKRVRDEAEENYLKTIEKRQKLYDAATQRSAYVIGDLVGLKIDRVDRTNVTAKILPCKIMSIQISSNDTNMYRLCAKTCILSTSYQIQDLSDLTKCNFNDLRTVDPSTLPTKTFIQVCQEYMCISSGVDISAEACHCKGQCATKHCSCKAKKVTC
ncbi:unnamed protein product, partial [Didymodactylos carnosus]